MKVERTDGAHKREQHIARLTCEALLFDLDGVHGMSDQSLGVCRRQLRSQTELLQTGTPV
ncbi:MAG: hypothetical protein M3373_11500 [Gemmatimonadota bacterium]|nr:hypothetical protein [Gemmatimonadota bacterium]